MFEDRNERQERRDVFVVVVLVALVVLGGVLVQHAAHVLLVG